MGREKDPANSEVARLIQQAIEQDKRRLEMQKQESLLRQQMMAQGGGSHSEDQRFDDTESESEPAYPYPSDGSYVSAFSCSAN